MFSLFIFKSGSALFRLRLSSLVLQFMLGLGVLCHLLLHTGDALAASQNTDAAQTSVPRFKMVAAGSEHFLALDEQGNLWSWGENTFGQLGVGDDDEISALANGVKIVRNRPAIIGKEFVYISVFGHANLAVKADGSLWGWGYQVPGLDMNKRYKRPTIVNRMWLKEVHLGDRFAFLRDSKDILWRLGIPGEKESRELGYPTYYTAEVQQIAVSGEHAVVMLNDGTVWTFGTQREVSLLGRPLTGDYPDLVQIGADDYQSVDTQMLFTQLLMKDGTTEYLGDLSYLKPILAANPSTKKNYLRVNSLYQGIYQYHKQYAGEAALYLLHKNGDLDYLAVQFERDAVKLATPVKVGSDFSMIRSSYDLLIGLKKDGSIWVWGHSYQSVPGIALKALTVTTPQAVIFKEQGP